MEAGKRWLAVDSARVATRDEAKDVRQESQNLKTYVAVP